MTSHSNRNNLLGKIAGMLIPGFKKSSPTAEDLHRTDFKTSTRRIGVRFNEKIRRVFRFRWLKIKENKHTRQ